MIIKGPANLFYSSRITAAQNVENDVTKIKDNYNPNAFNTIFKDITQESDKRASIGNTIQFLTIIFILIFFSNLFSQTNTNDITPQLSDSLKIKNTSKWLNLKNWNQYQQGSLRLEYSSPIYKFDKKMYDPSRVMPKDPFKIDRRSGSYYVPRMVRDELTHIMNRPKDSAFMPVLGVAFLAAQLAANYLIIQDKISISAQNIINSSDNKELLKILWLENPVTLTHIFKKPDIRKKHTMQNLQDQINLLVDNKLVKQKSIENNETQYFPAITNQKYIELIEKSLVDTSITETNRTILKKLLTWSKSDMK